MAALVAVAMAAALTTMTAPTAADVPESPPPGPWRGTISVVSSDAFKVATETKFEHSTEASYSDLELMDSGLSDESRYHATVSLSKFREVWTTPCASGHGLSSIDSFMSYFGPSTAKVDSADDDDIQFGADGVAIELWDAAEGTFFYPHAAFFNATQISSGCGWPDTTARQGNGALSYQHGHSHPPDTPLVDTDPDPDRLVGTTTYKLATVPGGAVWDYSAYSYSVTYDLWRTQPDEPEKDSDGDGLSDKDEVELYDTDPFDVDSDNDFLEDGVEVFVTFTDPTDADSDNGGVIDGREVLWVQPATSPLTKSDDLLRNPYSFWWHDLVEKARKDYKLSKSLGKTTAGYYHQVLNLVCSAAGVSSGGSAPAASVKACAPMKVQVGKHYGKWSKDFVWDVFADFVPGAAPKEEVKEIERQAKKLTKAICEVFFGKLNFIGVRLCIRTLKEEVGFAWAGTLHAAHHLYPNFKGFFVDQLQQARRPTGPVRVSILKGNLAAARANHEDGLFKKAVKPGFKVVHEINRLMKTLLNEIVPRIATCERETSIREAYRSSLGNVAGADLYRKVTAEADRVAERRTCKAWMKLMKLL